ncbi:MAG: hypothetical protein IJR57_02525 [Ruminococcus sp.]|nr:hypothetical protein [Ruminococcus sp.]
MNTAPEKKNKNKVRSPFGILLIMSLAVIILVLNILSFSYSWFTPTAETKNGLAFDDSFNLRSENCTFKTYKGVVVTADNRAEHSGYYIDQIDYEDTALEDKYENEQWITIPANGGRVYFRTEIQNQDTKYPSVVSLYHHNMPANLSIAVTYPSNTFYTTDAAYPDCFILRNAYVKVKDDNDADGPGILPVEWFLENTTSNDIKIRVTKQTVTGNGYSASNENPIYWLYLMYN